PRWSLAVADRSWRIRGAIGRRGNKCAPDHLHQPMVRSSPWLGVSVGLQRPIRRWCAVATGHYFWGTALISRQFWGFLSDHCGGLYTILAASVCQAAALVGFAVTQDEAGLFAVSAAFELQRHHSRLRRCVAPAVSGERSILACAHLVFL